MDRCNTLVVACAVYIFHSGIDSFADSAASLSAGDIEFARATFPTTSDTISFTFPVDLDGDGDTDVVLPGGTAPSEGGGPRGRQDGLILFNNGDNSFTPAIGNLPGSESAQELLVDDFNGDGINDLLVSAYSTDFSGTSLQLFLNKGNRDFVNDTLRLLGQAALDPDPEVDVPYFLSVLDVNGDGTKDLLPNFSVGTVDRKPFLFEGSGHGCFNSVTMAKVAPDAAEDSDTRRELGQFPLYSALEFGYGSFGALMDNGQQKIYLNYVPVTIAPRPLVANSLHSCSGKLKLTLVAEGVGVYSGEFSVVTTAPEVILQLDLASGTALRDTR